MAHISKIFKTPFFVVLTLISTAATADQCSWLTAAASSRLEELNRSGQISGNRFVEYCKPCGDKAPQGPYLISKIRKKKIDSVYTEYYFVVQGKEKAVDLAYVFIQSGANRYINLGKATNCQPVIENSSEINLN